MSLTDSVLEVMKKLMALIAVQKEQDVRIEKLESRATNGSGGDTAAISEELSAVKADLITLQSKQNTNLFAQKDFRTGTSLSSNNRFESSTQFIITAKMGEWIRIPALDRLTEPLQTGTLYTFSALTTKRITELSFYLNAETQYLKATRKEVGGYYLYTAQFTLNSNTTVQTHMNLTANSGEILEMKLEKGGESTLLVFARQFDARITALENRLSNSSSKPKAVYVSRAELLAMSGLTTVGNNQLLTVNLNETFANPPMVVVSFDIAGNYLGYVSNITQTKFNVACNYSAGLKGIWYYLVSTD